MSAVMKLREFSSYTVYPSVAIPPASSQSQMDTAIKRLREGASRFARLSIDERIRLAETMQQGLLGVAQRMTHAGCKAKGISLATPAEAEEWATGPWGLVRQLRLIRASLAAIGSRGNTPLGPVSDTPDGRLSVRVSPGNAIDGLLFKNVTVDVHMQAGMDRQTLDASRAPFYKKGHDGRVVLVLGAGNIAAIAPMDVATKMFNEGKVCLLKMNPVNAYLGPLIEEAFAEVIKRNFFAVVYGGAEEGRYLVYHRDIDDVHITGSDKTHDQIVWGPPGVEREARMERNEPLLKKPITSELGNVSPVIVVPGPYTDKELRFQAEDAASYVVMNASFLCNAAKMLVTPRGWSGSDTFVQGLQDVCAAVPPRQAYYPGAEDRWQALTVWPRGRDADWQSCLRRPAVDVCHRPGSGRAGRSAVHAGTVLLGALGSQTWQLGSRRVPGQGRNVRQRQAVGHSDRDACGASEIAERPPGSEGGRRGDCETALRHRDRQRLLRPLVRVRRAALGRVPRLDAARRTERAWLRAQYLDARGHRKGGDALSAHDLPKARLLRDPPHHASPGAEDRDDGRERELGQGAWHRLHRHARLSRSEEHERSRDRHSSASWNPDLSSGGWIPARAPPAFAGAKGSRAGLAGMTGRSAHVIVDRYVAAWSQRDQAALVNCFVEGGLYSDPVAGELSGSAIGVYAAGLFAAFPDLTIEPIGTSTMAGRTIAFEWRMRGTNNGPYRGLPATGKSIDLPGVDVLEVDGDRIRSLRGYFDTRAVPEQLGLQVIVQLQSIGPFQWGTSTRFTSGSTATPGVFAVTSIEPRSDQEVEQIRNLARQVAMDMLRMEGFISATLITCGNRQMTFTAWEKPEQVRQIYASSVHKEAMNKFYSPDLAAGGVFGMMRPDRISNTLVRCAQCGSMVELKPDVLTCACGAPVERRSFW